MASCGMLCRVDLVRTDVSEEPSASVIRVTIICALGTTLVVTSNRCVACEVSVSSVKRLTAAQACASCYLHSLVSIARFLYCQERRLEVASL
jgi:hypothetical protein